MCYLWGYPTNKVFLHSHLWDISLARSNVLSRIYFFCQGSDWYLFVFHSHIRTRTIDKRVKYNIGGFIHLSKFFISPPPYLYGIPPDTVLSQSKWPFKLSIQPTLSFNLVSRYILMLNVSDETLFLPSYFQKNQFRFWKHLLFIGRDFWTDVAMF